MLKPITISFGITSGLLDFAYSKINIQINLILLIKIFLSRQQILLPNLSIICVSFQFLIPALLIPPSTHLLFTSSRACFVSIFKIIYAVGRINWNTVCRSQEDPRLIKSQIIKLRPFLTTRQTIQCHKIFRLMSTFNVIHNLKRIKIESRLKILLAQQFVLSIIVIRQTTELIKKKTI